jgi:hypothetical protein
MEFWTAASTGDGDESSRQNIFHTQKKITKMDEITPSVDEI